MVMNSMEAKIDIKQVGRTLYELLSRHNLLTTALSIQASEALHKMATAGVPLPAVIVSELSASKALAVCVAHCSTQELVHLRNAMSRAASSGVALELMALWSLVHTTISSALSTETLAALVANVNATEDMIEPLREAVVSQTQAVGQLLLHAFASSMALASSVSVELQDVVKDMAQHGIALPREAAHLRDELKANAALIAQSLPMEKLQELETHLRHAVSSELTDLRDFAGQLKHAVASLPPIPVVAVATEAVKQTATDLVYNNPFSQAIADNSAKLEASMAKLFSESRESVDNAVEAVANGVASTAGCGKSCLAPIQAELPPLLRVEIFRDFSQTISLFFTNLYGTIASHKNAPVVRTTQLFFQSIFNIVSADFTALCF